MKKDNNLEILREEKLFEIEGGFVTTAPQLGVFIIAEWLKSLFS